MRNTVSLLAGVLFGFGLALSQMTDPAKVIGFLDFSGNWDPTLALVLGGARWPAWIGLIAFAAHLVWQIRRLDIGDPALCLRVFKSNRDAGLLLFAGLLVDAAMRAG